MNLLNRSNLMALNYKKHSTQSFLRNKSFQEISNDAWKEYAAKFKQVCLGLH